MNLSEKSITGRAGRGQVHPTLNEKKINLKSQEVHFFHESIQVLLKKAPSNLAKLHRMKLARLAARPVLSEVFNCWSDWVKGYHLSRWASWSNWCLRDARFTPNAFSLLVTIQTGAIKVAPRVKQWWIQCQSVQWICSGKRRDAARMPAKPSMTEARAGHQAKQAGYWTPETP